MAQLTDIQLESLFDAMKAGTPLFKSLKDMGIDEKPVEVRNQLIEKYTQEEFQRVMRENVRPNMNTPEIRIEMIIARMMENNPEKVTELKAKIQSVIDQY